MPEVRRFDSVTSTMDVALRAAEQGAAEGLVIVADEQTAGRGRRGRVWQSPPGAGLYLTFVFRPPNDPPTRASLGVLTLAAGVAVHDAILHGTGLQTELKWPNDVMVDGRKLAGILAEGVRLGSPGQAVLLGIGLNLRAAAYPPEVAARATSLEEELGRAVDAGGVLEALLTEVPREYHRLRDGDADAILRDWRAAAPNAVGRRVEWDTSDGLAHGTAEGIDASGALVVRTSTGVERIVGGEVRWI